MQITLVAEFPFTEGLSQRPTGHISCSMVNGENVILGPCRLPCPLLLFDILLLPEATASACYNVADNRPDLGLLVTLWEEEEDMGEKGEKEERGNEKN